MNGNTLPQTKEKNLATAAKARKRRAHFLTLVPDEFQVSDAMKAWGLKVAATNAQVRMMVKRFEIEPTSEYRTPRTYRKINGGASTQLSKGEGLMPGRSSASTQQGDVA